MTRFFITRVELHNLEGVKDTRKLYADLHKELEAKGFYKEILASDKAHYYLPDAVYESFTNKKEEALSAKEVHKLARQAIDIVIDDIKKTLPKSTLYGSSFTAEVKGLNMSFGRLKKVVLDETKPIPVYPVLEKAQ